MKIICSEGGPLIGLDRRVVDQWSGVFGKRFVGEASPFANDYEAVCYLIDGRNNPVKNISKFSSSRADGLIIAIPVETFIVKQSVSSILIAQIEAADESWSTEEISRYKFDQIHFDKESAFIILVDNCEFMFFDASYDGKMIGDDYLSVAFSRGAYRVSDGFYKVDDAELNLFKIERV